MMETLVGGGLVLVGVAVTQLVHSLTAHKDRKERRERLLREKYEELCDSILDTATQVQQMLKLSGNEAIYSSPPSAPQRVHYLAMIYFPELRDATREYNNSIVLLYHFLISGFDPKIPASTGAQSLGHPDYLENLNNMADKRMVLEQAIETNAAKYTKA